MKKVRTEPKNHLDDNFYRVPQIARATLTTRQLRETLLYTDGRIMAFGSMWDIVTKRLGAGVHLVTLREAVDARREGTAPAPEADLLDLLRKLSNGGGRRTGELRRRGWLTWEVTEAGRAALGAVDARRGEDGSNG